MFQANTGLTADRVKIALQISQEDAGMELGLKGKVVAVTGGSEGIGIVPQ